MMQTWFNIQKRSDLYKTKPYSLSYGNIATINFVWLENCKEEF
jgi:hypothetical protein